MSGQLSGGRRLGYMGHLIDALGYVKATVSASDEFRALIESSLSSNIVGDGEPAGISPIDTWREMLEENENELQNQNRLLADCNPQDFGREVGFPSNPTEYENDSEEYDYQYNSTMQ